MMPMHSSSRGDLAVPKFAAIWGEKSGNTYKYNIAIMTTTTSFASIFATMKEQSRGLVTAMSDMGTKTRDGMADTGTKMRAGGGGGSGGFISSIADAGAKTLLKVRI